MADTLTVALKPDIITKFNPTHKTEILEASSGHEQRINRWATYKRAWTFTWMATPTNYASLVTFFNNQGGRFKFWYITDTRIGTLVPVRFDSDKLDVSPAGWRYFDVTANIVEVF